MNEKSLNYFSPDDFKIKSSGAIYSGVPSNTFVRSIDQIIIRDRIIILLSCSIKKLPVLLCNCIDVPKSTSFKCRVSEKTKFSGFISLCTIF